MPRTDEGWESLIDLTDRWASEQNLSFSMPWASHREEIEDESAEAGEEAVTEPAIRNQGLGDSNESQENPEGHLSADEPLLEVARRQPVEAARFLEVVLLSGILLGLALPFPCGAFFLSNRWDKCGSCARPLHVWVLIHCLLHFLQSPLRMILLQRLRQRGADAELFLHDGDLEGKVRRLASSRTWKISTAFSTAAYAWFVVGVVWILNADFCRPCPDLYRLSLCFMAVAILKPIFTVAAFRYAFGTDQDGETDPQNRAQRGACEELIVSLPLEQYPFEQILPDRQANCAVCLCDYEGGELLRRLPCGHKFHSQCIDKWLRQNKVCPLCLRDAELPPPGMARAATGRTLLERGFRLFSHEKVA